MDRREEQAARAQLRAAFRSAVREWRPDLIISLLNWGEWILHETIDDLTSIPKVGWLMDDPFQVDAESRGRMLPAGDQ